VSVTNCTIDRPQLTRAVGFPPSPKAGIQTSDVTTPSSAIYALKTATNSTQTRSIHTRRAPNMHALPVLRWLNTQRGDRQANGI